ncbi:MMPL family transporter [Cryptosporangium minutisporangium]|uniref:MMPL family transporter n=1 Tax=Cryptosporangium minutisporangium TaxID=113569 RepID=A0ABP6SVM5_9ACTN
MAGLARWCYRHRIVVVVLWVVGLLGLGAASQTAGSAYNDSFALPGTESTKALDLLQNAFPEAAGDQNTIVWHTDSGSVKDPAVQQRIDEMLAEVADSPSVTSVTSPYTDQGATQISRDGTIAYATVTFNGQAEEIDLEHIENVIGLAEDARTDGLDVELGGNAIQVATQAPPGSSEIYGLMAAAVILLIAFGSVLAMAIPLITAVLALAGGLTATILLSHVMSVATIAPTVGALIGLGVGIDYALFIVTRHRNGLKAGLSVEESTIRALNTSGRAVVFAGITVCIALLGLLVLNLSFLTGIGVSASVVVLFSVLAAVTLLPALLGFFGMRVLSRRERRRLAAEGPHDAATRGVWARWAGIVERRPRMLAAIAITLIAVLSIPTLSIRLGSSDQGNNPADTTTRKAYDLLADGFGPGFNGPLQLVAELKSPGDTAALNELVERVRDDSGVAAVMAMPTEPGAELAIVQVIPTTSPQSEQTSELITRLREDVVPSVEQGNTIQVHVGGLTAIFDDFADVLTSKLPLFLGVIIGLGFLLLMVAFRSLLVPLTAAVMNVLAAAASFGVIVAVFQWGWGVEALGGGAAGPVEAFMPVMMLAILFGLSMDYQVFLVSRMHEEWVHTGDNRRAVRVGQASTGRVITAAAAIMIFVFGAFIFEGERVIAEFGVGLASAVFIDAFILRTLLVPALMHLFGSANWWIPKWLDRILPHLTVEPADEPVAPPRPEEKPEPVPVG